MCGNFTNGETAAEISVFEQRVDFLERDFARRELRAFVFVNRFRGVELRSFATNIEGEFQVDRETFSGAVVFAELKRDVEIGVDLLCGENDVARL